MAHSFIRAFLMVQKTLTRLVLGLPCLALARALKYRVLAHAKRNCPSTQDGYCRDSLALPRALLQMFYKVTIGCYVGRPTSFQYVCLVMGLLVPRAQASAKQLTFVEHHSGQNRSWHAQQITVLDYPDSGQKLIISVLSIIIIVSIVDLHCTLTQTPNPWM